MKLHFITFADGMNEKYMNAANALKKMAEDYDMFSTIKIYTFEDLKKDTEFITKHEQFILQNRRGFGYWIWKPYIIWKTLLAVDDGDIVLYLDSCCSLHVEGKARFLEYIEITKNNPSRMMTFVDPNLTGTWTKMDILNTLDALHLKDNPQIMGGIQIVSRTEQTLLFYKYLYDTTISQNYHLVDDSPSILPNLETFRENRHDQAILSILAYKMFPSSAHQIIDEIYFWGKVPDKSFPIHIHSNGYS